MKTLNEILVKEYGLTREVAEDTTVNFLKTFRSCPDNSETTLELWRSYLWYQALPDNYKYLNEKIYKIWLHLRYHYLSLTNEYENLLKILQKNYFLALITNGPSNAQWEKIKMLNLGNYFDCILVSSDLPWEKPNSNIFLTACNILDVKPQQCIMIGDKLETDIKGGKAAQLGGTIWIPLNRDNCKDVRPKPDVTLFNLCEILKYLPANNEINEKIETRRHNLIHRNPTRKLQQLTRGLNQLDMDSNSENSLDSC